MIQYIAKTQAAESGERKGERAEHFPIRYIVLSKINFKFHYGMNETDLHSKSILQCCFIRIELKFYPKSSQPNEFN